MKRINTVFLIPALLLASCSEDTDMTTYNGRSDEAFFEKTAYSYSVSADLEDSYTIEVLRATPSGNASVKAEIIVDDETIAEPSPYPRLLNLQTESILLKSRSHLTAQDSQSARRMSLP
jgi:lipoprotein